MNAAEEFIVPSDLEIQSEIGVEPTDIDGAEGARKLSLIADDGDAVDVIIDPLRRSATILMMRSGVRTLQLNREFAVRAEIEGGPFGSRIRITFEAPALGGELTVTVADHVMITDYLLEQ